MTICNFLTSAVPYHTTLVLRRGRSLLPSSTTGDFTVEGMALRIQNYGDGENEKRRKLRGYHPPACTCFACNEEQLTAEAAKEEERRVAEYDRRVASSQAPSQSQVGPGQIRNLSPQPSRPAPSNPASGHNSPQHLANPRGAGNSPHGTLPAPSASPSAGPRSQRNTPVSRSSSPRRRRSGRTIFVWAVFLAAVVAVAGFVLYINDAGPFAPLP